MSSSTVIRSKPLEKFLKQARLLKSHDYFTDEFGMIHLKKYLIDGKVYEEDVSHAIYDEGDRYYLIQLKCGEELYFQWEYEDLPNGNKICREKGTQSYSKKKLPILEAFRFLPRIFLSLRKFGITKTEELLNLSAVEVMQIHGIGQASFFNIEDELQSHGLSLKA